MVNMCFLACIQVVMNRTWKDSMKNFDLCFIYLALLFVINLFIIHLYTSDFFFLFCSLFCPRTE